MLPDLSRWVGVQGATMQGAGQERGGLLGGRGAQVGSEGGFGTIQRAPGTWPVSQGS